MWKPLNINSLNQHIGPIRLALSALIALQSAASGEASAPAISPDDPRQKHYDNLAKTGPLLMSQLIIEELPYHQDSAPLFAKFLNMKQPIYLDSARPYSTRGRYDIFSAEPIANHTTQKYPSTSINYEGNLNYFRDLREALGEHLPPINNDYQLPFIGGALGYLGYDLGRQLEKLPQRTATTQSLPVAAIGFYSWAVIADHQLQRTLLVAHPAIKTDLLQEIRLRLKSAQPANRPAFTLCSDFISNMPWPEYEKAFSRIQHYIQSGDCYQINLTQRFTANYSGDPWEAYKAMRATAAAPYSGYMNYEDCAILCLSPERFLHVSNQRVTTSPIKGTIARNKDPATDEKLAQQLLNSSKDRAENVMIVDLLRNDLGKSCIPGSIQVDELFELQSFETVHHLVSTISGQLAQGEDPISLLQACFPGGSITGAPKVRAMEIIEELEPDRRSVYCGSMGYISCDGQMDFNIAIRTLLCENNTIHCSAGGGIVADSNSASEYRECFTKVEKLMAALPVSST